MPRVELTSLYVLFNSELYASSLDSWGRRESAVGVEGMDKMNGSIERATDEGGGAADLGKGEVEGFKLVVMATGLNASCVLRKRHQQRLLLYVERDCTWPEKEILET